MTYLESNVTILVENMDRAVRFYTETLGLPLRVRFGDHWAEVQAPGVVIGLHPVPADLPTPKASSRVSVGFQVPNLDAALTELRQRGVSFASEVVESGPRRLADFADPDGTPLYLIEMSDWSGKQ